MDACRSNLVGYFRIGRLYIALYNNTIHASIRTRASKSRRIGSRQRARGGGVGGWGRDETASDIRFDQFIQYGLTSSRDGVGQCRAADLRFDHFVRFIRFDQFIQLIRFDQFIQWSNSKVAKRRGPSHVYCIVHKGSSAAQQAARSL